MQIYAGLFTNFVIIILSHYHIENHHQHETEREADSTEVGVRAVGGFGSPFSGSYLYLQGQMYLSIVVDFLRLNKKGEEPRPFPPTRHSFVCVCGAGVIS